MSEVLYRRSNECAVLTLNRPAALNTITNEMLSQLELHLERIEHDDSRALVLTGTGRAFCAGTDLNQWHGDPQQRLLRVHALLRRLLDFPKISVAAINGLALGGGLEFPLACTFRVARRSAKLGLPEVKLGLLPAYGGTQLLPRLVGEAAALDMLYTGRRVTGDEAVAMGLCQRLVPLGEVRSVAIEIATDIAVSAPLSLRAIRRTMRVELAHVVEQATIHEHEVQVALRGTEDYEEGVRAYGERRPPSFTGR